MSQSFPTMVKVTRDPDADERRRPLSMAIIRRLWALMRPYSRKRNCLIALVLFRAVQLPALAWSIGAVINGPITGRAPLSSIVLASLGVLALAALTQFCLVFRQRLATRIGRGDHSRPARSGVRTPATDADVVLHEDKNRARHKPHHQRL